MQKSIFMFLWEYEMRKPLLVTDAYNYDIFVSKIYNV